MPLNTGVTVLVHVKLNQPSIRLW